MVRVVRRFIKLNPQKKSGHDQQQAQTQAGRAAFATHEPHRTQPLGAAVHIIRTYVHTYIHSFIMMDTSSDDDDMKMSSSSERKGSSSSSSNGNKRRKRMSSNATVRTQASHATLASAASALFGGVPGSNPSSESIVSRLHDLVRRVRFIVVVLQCMCVVCCRCRVVAEFCAKRCWCLQQPARLRAVLLVVFSQSVNCSH
jgi:hypothetical protein